ncbi:BnaC03g29530D [Brassica napus]|uniref:BnaC03g29530D protein n=1 Tax=Brassica napus TaxID=3708 RepID=A0A078G794_BRANA|nr:BnaC03g29530D [Brassica napus]
MIYILYFEMEVGLGILVSYIAKKKSLHFILIETHLR